MRNISGNNAESKRSRIRKFAIGLATVIIPLYRVNGYATFSSSNSRIATSPLQPIVRNDYEHAGGFKRNNARLGTILLVQVGRDNESSLATDSTFATSDEEDKTDQSRRRALQTFFATASVMAVPAMPAFAGKPEVDASGILYSPKADMLSGGSKAARGIRIERGAEVTRVLPGQAFQTVYETRFIAYLSRFLLTFDPTVNAWWAAQQQSITGSGKQREALDAKFAEFANSVEIGLADYFVGPYGSYSSLSAIKAGVSATKPAKSARADDPTGFRESLFMKKEKRQLKAQDRDRSAKQGVLNLYTLLKARYSSTEAKRQLAILFSFFSNPNLQPTAEISSLLGEADDACVSKINLSKPTTNEITSRTSCRRGGGYSLADVPTISVETPPALGSSYQPAKAEAIMKPTSRILKIKVTDGGEGYTMPPDVFVGQGAQRQCTACAILDREGHVESVLVLDPGYGYAKRRLEAPKVVIAPPPTRSNGKDNKKRVGRRAKARAELEYEITGIKVKAGGNGYVASSPPKVIITPPKEDPDWYVESAALSVQNSESATIKAEVSEMKGPTGEIEFSLGGVFRPNPIKVALERIREDPLQLLPSSVRPEINSYGVFVIPPVAAVPTYSSSPNPRYREVDPLFGAIGTVPVTKSATELKPSEYGRLALSGAVCTVLVRTALNPLELIKTKQQLQNDQELLSFAGDNIRSQKAAANANNSTDTKTKDEKVDETEDNKIGTGDMISSLVELRGPLALFQSADITFLASLVFGSFGFGATELFRRSFSGVFFSDGGGTELGSELVLLLAATVATVITSAAAAPFELLRVRSMGLIESKSWTNVLGDFIKEKAANGNNSTLPSTFDAAKSGAGSEDFSLKDVQPKDLLPLWAGFPPTASRELAFAIPKFLAFDILAKTITGFVNSQADPGSLPIQVGVGSTGLIISAISGAIAGLAGAIVSHPADLILTYTSASKKKKTDSGDEEGADWKAVVKDLLGREGGIANLFVGLTPRLLFFFLVIGLQFFLYDYVKNLLNVGSDDLSLVLDVFYAVRRGLVEMTDAL